jgi:hypothetical protein
LEPADSNAGSKENGSNSNNDSPSPSHQPGPTAVATGSYLPDLSYAQDQEAFDFGFAPIGDKSLGDVNVSSEMIVLRFRE